MELFLVAPLRLCVFALKVFCMVAVCKDRRWGKRPAAMQGRAGARLASPAGTGAAAATIGMAQQLKRPLSVWSGSYNSFLLDCLDNFHDAFGNIKACLVPIFPF